MLASNSLLRSWNWAISRTRGVKQGLGFCAGSSMRGPSYWLLSTAAESVPHGG